MRVPTSLVSVGVLFLLTQPRLFADRIAMSYTIEHGMHAV